MKGATNLKTRMDGMYYGWRMVAIGAIISCVGSVQTASLSVFFLPLQRELALSRAQLSFVFSLTRLEGSIESPIVGWMIDKYGPRLPIVTGAVLGGVGFLILPLAQTFWPFFIIYMGMISIGFQMGFISSMHAVANLWFIRYRTRAMSFYSSSLRLGNAIFAPVLGLIVAASSWRYGSVFAAAVVLIIALPLAALIKRSPESMGLLPDGDTPEAIQQRGRREAENPMPQVRIEEADFDLSEALKSVSYWLIITSTTVRYLIIGAIHMHWVPIFVWKGYSEVTGAAFIGFASLIAWPLILLNGVLGDRFSKRLILMSGHTSLLLSMFVLAYSDSLWTIYLFSVLFSYGEGGSPTDYSIIGEYFGRRSFATLRGLVTTFTTVAIFSPVYAGWIFDKTQDYTDVLYACVGIAVFAIFILLFLKRPRKVVLNANHSQ